MNTKRKHQIEDLHDHMFQQLERLKDPGCDLDKEMKRAAAMVSVGNVIVNSAKAEVDFMRVTKSKGSNFLTGHSNKKQLTNGSDK